MFITFLLLSENSFILPSSFHFGKKKTLEFSFDRVNFLSIMCIFLEENVYGWILSVNGEYKIYVREEMISVKRRTRMKYIFNAM